VSGSGYGLTHEIIYINGHATDDATATGQNGHRSGREEGDRIADREYMKQKMDDNHDFPARLEDKMETNREKDREDLN
jgi:hypothetical protein